MLAGFIPMSNAAAPKHAHTETQDARRGGSPDPRICRWCANRTRDVCFERCQAEGRYRYLEPEPEPVWRAPFALPPFRELVDLPAAERLALLYLAAHYAQSR
jgi:hypothetical protein